MENEVLIQFVKEAVLITGGDREKLYNVALTLSFWDACAFINELEVKFGIEIDF